MPNTLAHLGLSGLATRGLCRDADLRWIYIGAIIPDLPWILQRILRIMLPSLNALDLRLYVVVQATFFFSLILSACFSLLSPLPRKTFFILAFGAFFHLILDAFQIKWANGVHFFAPLDWGLFQFALVWPESWPNYLVTGLGFVYVLFTWKKTVLRPLPVFLSSSRRLFVALLLFVLYVLLPVFMMASSEAKDNHFTQTLRDVEGRKGKVIAFDRAFYRSEGSGQLHIFTGEIFNVVGLDLHSSSKVSVRGIFLDSHTVQVKAYRLHSSYFRDSASYLGLFLIAFVWAWGVFRWGWKQRSGIKP